MSVMTMRIQTIVPPATLMSLSLLLATGLALLQGTLPWLGLSVVLRYE